MCCCTFWKRGFLPGYQLALDFGGSYLLTEQLRCLRLSERERVSSSINSKQRQRGTAGFIQGAGSREKCWKNWKGLSRAGNVLTKIKLLSCRICKSLGIFRESINLHNSYISFYTKRCCKKTMNVNLYSLLSCSFLSAAAAV